MANKKMNKENNLIKILKAVGIVILGLGFAVGTGMSIALANSNSQLSNSLDSSHSALIDVKNELDLSNENIVALNANIVNMTELTALDKAVIADMNESYIAALAELEATEGYVPATADVSESLDLVLDFAYDNDGDLSELEISDLDDDELESIMDRIVLINMMKTLAVDEADKEFTDEIDKMEFVINNETITFDEDDIERVRVEDDDEDVNVSDIDFDDEDATVTLDVKFEQNDIKYLATVEIDVKDGEADDIDITTVVLR